jgi:hypothetical protein
LYFVYVVCFVYCCQGSYCIVNIVGIQQRCSTMLFCCAGDQTGVKERIVRRLYCPGDSTNQYVFIVQTIYHSSYCPPKLVWFVRGDNRNWRLESPGLSLLSIYCPMLMLLCVCVCVCVCFLAFVDCRVAYFFIGVF